MSTINATEGFLVPMFQFPEDDTPFKMMVGKLVPISDTASEHYAGILNRDQLSTIVPESLELGVIESISALEPAIYEVAGVEEIAIAHTNDTEKAIYENWNSLLSLTQEIAHHHQIPEAELVFAVYLSPQQATEIHQAEYQNHYAQPNPHTEMVPAEQRTENQTKKPDVRISDGNIVSSEPDSMRYAKATGKREKQSRKLAKKTGMLAVGLVAAGVPLLAACASEVQAASPELHSQVESTSVNNSNSSGTVLSKQAIDYEMSPDISISIANNSVRVLPVFEQGDVDQVEIIVMDGGDPLVIGEVSMESLINPHEIKYIQNRMKKRYPDYDSAMHSKVIDIETGEPVKVADVREQVREICLETYGVGAEDIDNCVNNAQVMLIDLPEGDEKDTGFAEVIGTVAQLEGIEIDLSTFSNILENASLKIDMTLAHQLHDITKTSPFSTMTFAEKKVAFGIPHAPSTGERIDFPGRPELPPTQEEIEQAQKLFAIWVMGLAIVLFGGVVVAAGVSMR